MAEIACPTDVGVKRDRNEDEVLCVELNTYDSTNLLCVADGMDEMASKVATEGFKRFSCEGT